MLLVVCFINYREHYIIYSLCNLVQSNALLVLCDTKHPPSLNNLIETSCFLLYYIIMQYHYIIYSM